MQNALTHNDAKTTVCDWAQAIMAEFEQNPEKINNSKHTAPSKRLEKLTNYRKTTHGPNIAKEIGIPGLREKCTGFNQWIEALEQLAQAEVETVLRRKGFHVFSLRYERFVPGRSLTRSWLPK